MLLRHAESTLRVMLSKISYISSILMIRPEWSKAWVVCTHGMPCAVAWSPLGCYDNNNEGDGDLEESGAWQCEWMFWCADWSPIGWYTPRLFCAEQRLLSLLPLTVTLALIFTWNVQLFSVIVRNFLFTQSQSSFWNSAVKQYCKPV